MPKGSKGIKKKKVKYVPPGARKKGSGKETAPELPKELISDIKFRGIKELEEKAPKERITKRPVAINQERLERIVKIWERKLKEGVLSDKLEKWKEELKELNKMKDEEKREKLIRLTIDAIDNEIRKEIKNPYKAQNLLMLRALARLYLGEIEGAIRHLEAAYEKKDPKTDERIVNPELSHMYGLLLLYAGKYGDAIKPLKDYRELTLNEMEKEHLDSLIKALEEMEKKKEKSGKAREEAKTD